MIESSRISRQVRTLLWLLAGAACGLLWWGIASLLGAKQFGVAGSHAWTGPVAGVCTGMLEGVLPALVGA